MSDSDRARLQALDVAALRAELEETRRQRDEAMRYLNGGGPSSHVPRIRLDRVTAERDTARAEAAVLRERVARLEEALRFQDPRNAAERYERIADDFWRETGFWPPGRSRPAAMGPDPHQEEAHAAWRRFCNEWHERWFDRALAGRQEETTK